MLFLINTDLRKRFRNKTTDTLKNNTLEYYVIRHEIIIKFSIRTPLINDIGKVIPTFFILDNSFYIRDIIRH